MTDARLHMVRLGLDATRLFELGRRLGLPLREVDPGYLVHCQLAALFGELAPKPFVVSNEGRVLSILGYARADAAALRRHASEFADPFSWDGCDFDGLATKPMPAAWEAGQRLGFDVRVCPVVRKSSAGARHREGAEVDAFLARCWEVGEDVRVEREEVYRMWVAGRFAVGGAARLESIRLVAWKRERFIRRLQGETRTSRMVERPDVRMAGTLEVGDPAAFGALLGRGIGRHRAFGFGMLLLRPPRMDGC